MVGQENHFPKLAVHFDPRHHAAQLDGIVLAGRAGEADPVVAQNVPVATALEFARDPAAQVVLGAGDPADPPPRQVSQVGEVQIRLVAEDNFTSPHAGAEFAGADVVVFTGGADDGKTGRAGWQVQPKMALGRGLAAAVFGPVQTAGDQLDGGGIHQMDDALEAEGKLRTPPPAPKPGWSCCR